MNISTISLLYSPGLLLHAEYRQRKGHLFAADERTAAQNANTTHGLSYLLLSYEHLGEARRPTSLCRRFLIFEIPLKVQAETHMSTLNESQADFDSLEATCVATNIFF